MQLMNTFNVPEVETKYLSQLMCSIFAFLVIGYMTIYLKSTIYGISSTMEAYLYG